MCCGLCRLQGCIHSGVSSREIENNYANHIVYISVCKNIYFILCLQDTYVHINQSWYKDRVITG